MPSEASLAPWSEALAPRGRPRRTQKVDARGHVVVRVEDLHSGFGEGPVLRGVSFELMKGRVYSVIGPSGCGKTTLLRNLLALLMPTWGRIEILGQDIISAPPACLETLRTRMGVLFQSAALISSMSVMENVALPLRLHRGLAPREAEQAACVKLELVGMVDARDRMPGELSGGMKKRAAMVRAIALDPELLFLDEPTSGADPVTAAALDDILLDLTRRLEATAIVVTHDMRSAFRISHEIMMLWRGRIHHRGPPSDFIESDDAAISQFVRGARQGPLAGCD